MQIADLYQLFLQNPNVTTDTRQCSKGSVFFALRGASFDGNQFALQALENGCAYAVVDDKSVQGDERIIYVDNVLETLQQLATYHRHQLNIPVIQITGTNGKTTTKELTATVLASRYSVLYTQGNFNNHIGVPKTLLRMTPDHQLAVIETGANHPGEIAALSEIVDPDCGLITNVGRAHLEGFGSFEGVVKTKCELYQALRKKENGFVFLDGDNEYLVPEAEGLNAETYGKPGMGYGVEGEVLECNPMLKFRFRIKGGDWYTVQTHLIGAYNITNALAAIAVGVHFGVGAEEAAQAVASYVPSNNRSELMVTESNRLIVDAYNANPTSMKAALENFALIPDRHKMVILGEMRELGVASVTEHAKVAEMAKSICHKHVWFVGSEFRSFAGDAHWYPDVEAVKVALQGGRKPYGRLILIKGSNSTKLYELPEFL